MVTSNKVIGIKRSSHSIMLYALSTCVWCKKTKRLLDSLGVPYEFIDVDGLSGHDKTEVMEEVMKFNPRGTFPTMVIDGEQCIVGYKENQIKEAIS
jgi:glutaredoxin